MAALNYMKRNHRFFGSAAAFVAGLLFFSMPAYAEINGNEAELLSIINSTREYNGVTYQVKQQYRDAARAYLDDPSIDCTAEQKQKAINQMFGSIQQGIDEGYLVAVGGGSAQKATGAQKAESSAPSGAGATGGKSTGTTSSDPAVSDAATSDTSADATADETASAETGSASAEGTDGVSAEETENSSAQGAGSAENAQMSADGEAASQEAERSPIVLALEQAMDTTQEITVETVPGSLLPEMIYPSRFISLFAIGAAAAAVFAAAASFYFGLFHHHRSKREE